MNFAEHYRQKSVLVTGGTGFVGGWLVAALEDYGARVSVLTREAGRVSADFPRSVDLITGNLQDFAFVSGLLSSLHVETVFHLGAQPLVLTGREFPRETLDTNVRGTWNLLEAIRTRGSGQIILASSGIVCGQLQSLSAGNEGAAGVDPYGASKICAELVSRAYAGTFGVKAAIARFSNVYGGGDWNFSRLIPDLVCSTLNGKRLGIRSDGRGKLNLLYVKDAVRAYLLLGARLESDSALAGKAFHFGMPSSISMREVVDLVLGLMERPDLNPFASGAQAESVEPSLFDPEETYGVLGWMPEFSLREGLEETIGWYRSHNRPEPCAPVAERAMTGCGVL